MFRVGQMNLFVVNIDQATNLNNKYLTPRGVNASLTFLRPIQQISGYLHFKNCCNYFS